MRDDVARVRSIRVADPLWAKVEASAAAAGMKVSAYVVRVLERATGMDEDEAPSDPAPRPSPAPVRRAAAPTVKAAPVKAREVLAMAEEGASHLGARAMASAGLPFGNIRSPQQKKRADPASARPAPRR